MENANLRHWAIIINPRSGKRSFKQQCDYLFSTLKQSGISFESHLTAYAGHAIALARELAEKGCLNFLVVGGDGTLNEAVNGIFGSDTDKSAYKIAVIPRGTGNDWGRFWGLTRDYKQSINTFLQGNVRHIDIGKIECVSAPNPNTRFFINALGLGLDAKVVAITHRLRKIFGNQSFLYTVSLLMAVFSYRSRNIIVSSGNEHFEDKVLTMSIGNGCYTGGGLRQTPDAVPYDGLLDVMIAKQPTVWNVFTALRCLFNGSLLKHPIIRSFQTQTMEILCEENILLETDGIIVDGDSPYHVSIIPHAIQMVVPER